jgi:hypothetical protein
LFAKKNRHCLFGISQERSLIPFLSTRANLAQHQRLSDVSAVTDTQIKIKFCGISTSYLNLSMFGWPPNAVEGGSLSLEQSVRLASLV